MQRAAAGTPSRWSSLDARLKGFIALGVCAFIPLIDSNGAHLNFLADAATFVLLALGLNIVVGFAGLLDLGYAAFFAIGSYSYAMLASPQFGVHVPFWVMLFVASAIAAIFGILLGAPTLRLRGDYLAIVTLGFGEIVPQTFLNLSRWTNGPNGITALDQPVLFNYRFGLNPLPYFYVGLALVALAIVIAHNLQNSRLGRSWMAIREDELAAAHMGINITKTKLSAFALGASFSGLAGVAYASKLNLVSPDNFQFNVSVFVLSMLVLGGMGTIYGVIAGSVLLSSLERFILPQATSFAHSLGFYQLDFSNFRFMMYGVILVGIMLFRPEGLFPNRQRAAELHAAKRDEAVSVEQEALSEEAV
jgi:branched-chain amino acid transport system permease protein